MSKRNKYSVGETVYYGNLEGIIIRIDHVDKTVRDTSNDETAADYWLYKVKLSDNGHTEIFYEDALTTY